MAVSPEESVVLYHIRSQKNKDHPRWQAKYSDGHSFIWGRGEHPFPQLST